MTASMALTPSELRSRLTGPIAFPVTPFGTDLRLNPVGLRANVRTLVAYSPAAIVAAGGSGELYALTPSEHLAVVQAVVEEADGRVPVIAGVGFNSAIGSDLARQAAQAGADGILVFPPYYPNADDHGLVAYYRAIAAATSLGALIYSRDWFHPGPALVERLSAIDTLVGWKDGQGDVRRLLILMHAIGDRLQWIGGAGDDMVPAYYAAGIRAYTSSVSNVAPQLAIALHDLAARGDAAALRPIMQDLIVPLYALRARRRGHEVSVMKALMDLLGQAGGPVRPPLVDLSPDELVHLRRLVPGFQRWASAAAGQIPR
jgi:5-dehydro-4-deoxyglucarate dehydratase